jgi:hypothetical protein
MNTAYATALLCLALFTILEATLLAVAEVVRRPVAADAGVGHVQHRHARHGLAGHHFLILDAPLAHGCEPETRACGRP